MGAASSCCVLESCAHACARGRQIGSRGPRDRISEAGEGRACSATRASVDHSESAERHRSRPIVYSLERGSASRAESYACSAFCHWPSFSSHVSFTCSPWRCCAVCSTPRAASGCLSELCSETRASTRRGAPCAAEGCSSSARTSARISAHLGVCLRGGRRMEVELAVVQRLRVGLAAGGDVGERARGNGQRAVVPLHELGEREELLHTRGAGV